MNGRRTDCPPGEGLEVRLVPSGGKLRERRIRKGLQRRTGHGGKSTKVVTRSPRGFKGERRGEGRLSCGNLPGEGRWRIADTVDLLNRRAKGGRRGGREWRSRGAEVLKQQGGRGLGILPILGRTGSK